MKITREKLEKLPEGPFKKIALSELEKLADSKKEKK
jgi:DNA-binding Xre family transcriptional regulator